MGELEGIQRNQEMTLIINALKQSRNIVSKAAELLCMNRTTLSSKMDLYGIRGKNISYLDLMLRFIKEGKSQNMIEEKYENTNCSISDFYK